MEQLTQKLRSGQMQIQTLPMPQVTQGSILVRNHYSLISPGTEGATVDAARKSLVGKAKDRPQQVKQAIGVLKNQGPIQAYRAVMKKLDAYSPLGYSSAGEVIDVGADVHTFAIGDKVACAGAGYASHAEVVCVPKNLCVKLPQDADLKSASYNTLGAIALQGIRQADLRLGETCAVIGLGLIGQLTCLMLRASGVTVFGIDVSRAAVEIAEQHCADKAWIRCDAGVSEQIEWATGGLGVDAVIITAGTSSLDPINFAGRIARKKGRVVVVGAVPTGFDRDPYYYKKELELRMSCSYGPGRYDLQYEENGHDYPASYVRWTENRNMKAFQEFIRSGRINVDYLTTHEFTLEEAPEAYDMILDKSEFCLGIVLRYDTAKLLERTRIVTAKPEPAGKVTLAFIGAGSYAQGHLLPNIPKHNSDVTCKAVLTRSGTTSKRVAQRYGFEFCSEQPGDIFGNSEINTVFIATRHDTHAEYVMQALEAGKHVFVEKPLCLTAQQLEQIQQLYSSLEKPGHLMVGFNRRFAPLAEEVKTRIGNCPISALYRINAGAIPLDSWIQDTHIGGGRIIGEVCHFVDFLTWISGALPTSVLATALPDPKGLNDTVNINLTFANGSIGTICYYSNGSKSLAKEYIEIYSSGQTAVISDFKKLEIFSSGHPYRKKLVTQNKGQALMVKKFIDAVLTGDRPLIEAEHIFAVTKVCFCILESIRTRQVVSLEL